MVRGGLAQSDVTMEDAKAIGLTDLAPVIHTGLGMPGIQISDLPEDVLQVFETSDIIIAKGQGNVETMYSCGLRVSEACNLKLSDLYLNEGFIKVEGKGSKQRLVPISERAIAEIMAYMTHRAEIDIKPGHEDYLFVSAHFKKKMSRITMFHIIKELAEQAGIKKTISPHTLRHSFAVHLLENGKSESEIAELCGFCDASNLVKIFKQEYGLTPKQYLLQKQAR